MIVHPDNSYCRHELNNNWLDDIQKKLKEENILFAVFLRDFRISESNKEIIELLQNNTHLSNRIILNSNFLTGLDFIIQNQTPNGINQYETKSLLPRINSKTIITARGLYGDRCVIDHIAGVYEDYQNIRPSSIHIDQRTTIFSKDATRTPISFQDYPVL